MFSVVKVNKKPRPRRGLWLYSKTEMEAVIIPTVTPPFLPPY
nr:MAG TPA: hypothetical protein [Caudoviricetes sp.]